MNNEDTTFPTPGSNYAAAFLRKLISPIAEDPTAEDYARLAGKWLEIALAVLSEGRDEGRRRNRLNVELAARGFEHLQPMIEAADPTADLGNLESSRGWQIFDLADVMNESIPSTKWVVKYFVSKPSVTIFYGRPKHKKSMVVLDLCHHIASGLPWMISAPNGGDGIDITAERVVWVDLENGKALLKKRMRAFAKALEIDLARGQFQAYSLPDPWPDLSKPENTTALIERLQGLGNVGVLVLDHLSALMGDVDENSALAFQIMNQIRKVSETLGMAVVLIHHAKKGQGKDSGLPEDMLRGSGAILAGVDGAYLIERDPIDKNQVTITAVAVRGPEAPTLSANFAFTQDENLDLTAARFWRVPYRSKTARAQDAVLEALRANGKLNHTALRSAAKSIDRSLSDQSIREAIETLHGTRDIVYIKAGKGAKIYQLAGENEEDMD